MIAVIVDTNALRKNGLRSASTIELERIASRNILRLVVPIVVAREFTTHHAMETRSKLKSAARDLDSAARRLPTNSEFVVRARELSDSIGALVEPMVAAYERDFRDWLARCNAEILEFDVKNLQSIFDDYFAGDGAFRSIESREDFPDAFILASIRDCVRRFDRLHVISSDKRFCEAAKAAGAASCSEDIDAFLASKDISGLREAAQKAHDQHRVVEAFSDSRFLNLLAHWLANEARQISDIHLESSQIENVEALELPCLSVEIESPSQEVSSIIFDIFSPGDADVVIGVRFKSRARVLYVSLYSDFLDLPESRLETISEESFSDGLVELAENWEISFHGAITLDAKIASQNRMIRLADLTENLPRIDVTSAILLSPTNPDH